jgi:hypothetical protein
MPAAYGPAVHAPFKGAHLLRHSLATRLLASGASLAEIGDQSLPKSSMNLEFVVSPRGVLRSQCGVVACGKAVVEDPTPVEGFALTSSDLLLCCRPASASQTAGTTPVSLSEVFTIVSI